VSQKNAVIRFIFEISLSNVIQFCSFVFWQKHIIDLPRKLKTSTYAQRKTSQNAHKHIIIWNSKFNLYRNTKHKIQKKLNLTL